MVYFIITLLFYVFEQEPYFYLSYYAADLDNDLQIWAKLFKGLIISANHFILW